MNERDAILNRIREALRVPSPQPAQDPRGGPPGPSVEGEPYSRWLPAVGPTFEAQVAAFEAASRELRSDFRLLPDEAAAHHHLADCSRTDGWKRLAAHHGTLSTAAAQALGLPVLWTDQPFDKHDLEQCDAGITECDALIAQTGSVLVTSASAGGRALSVLPPHHVVVARRAQLLADLPGAFQLIRERYASNFPSMVSLITGPSRTGDIERILVLGAHGPKKLTILCW